MKKNRIIRLIIPVVFIGTLLLYVSWTRTEPNTREEMKPDFAEVVEIGNLEVTEFASYKNPELCLLIGDASLNDRKYVPLQQALKNKLVTVIETGSVNELKIDNNSQEYIYINSGDIVRGGKQDRTIQYDVIIAPGKKKVDLASFCVEHGRWSGRGSESQGAFSSSANSLSSKELKVAAKYKKNQSEVWSKVDKYQAKTNEKLNQSRAGSAARVEVRSGQSASSLELTLENDEIKKSKEQYRTALMRQLGTNNRAVGMAYFINGKLYDVNVYNNHCLFKDLFDKLLDAAIAEAISENDSEIVKTRLRPAGLSDIIHGVEKAFEKKDINDITGFIGAEPEKEKKLVSFTTIDKQKNNWLHRNWLDKTEE